MPRVRRNEFPDFSKKAITSSRFFQKLPALAGNLALNLYDDSWHRKGFIDKRINKWKPRRFKDKGRGSRGILVRSGRLRRSLRMKTSGKRVTIFTDVPYAKVHNEGGRVKGTFKVRAHKRKTRSGRMAKVKSHNRTVDMKLPQRQFMGHSDLLDKRIEKQVTKALNQIFK